MAMVLLRRTQLVPESEGVASMAGPAGGDLADTLLTAKVEDSAIGDGEDFLAEECSVGVALVEDFILIKAVGADGGGGIDGRSLGARAGGHRHLPHGDVLGDEGI